MIDTSILASTEISGEGSTVLGSTRLSMTVGAWHSSATNVRDVDEPVMFWSSKQLLGVLFSSQEQ